MPGAIDAILAGWRCSNHARQTTATSAAPTTATTSGAPRCLASSSKSGTPQACQRRRREAISVYERQLTVEPGRELHAKAAAD
jgi:hypothetical protein